MTGQIPAHLRDLPEAMREAVLARAATLYAATPPPPLSPASTEALRALLTQPAAAHKEAA